MSNSYTLPIPNTSIIRSTFTEVNYMKLIKNIVSEFTTFGADSIFNELITNKTFIAEAREARKQIKKHPSSFTNFTEKFSSLID